MKHEIESARTASEDPAASSSATRPGAASSVVHVTSADTPIDFHSAEFNVIDDLNDCAGDYRSFEPLGDIVTADMRHQMERQCNGAAGAFPVEKAVPPKANERQEGGPEIPEEMPPLTVVSRGRTLIIDTDARRAEECGARLGAQGLECTLVLTKVGMKEVPAPGHAFWGTLRTDSLSVSGAFGVFAADAAINGDRKPLAGWLSDKALSFDLVLDLQPVPSYAGELLPMGYYAPGPDPVKIEGALAEMPEMLGRFVKPQFTAFLDARCIHGLSRKRDCRRCLDICPFGAIQSEERKITVNPYLCQGCGACALACPAEAIRLLEPSREELLEALRETIQSRREEGQPAVVISDSEMAGETDHGRIHFRVEQIGHTGLELLLQALAFGAGSISVACGPQNPAGIKRAVEWQVQMADAVLQGLGMPADIVRFADDVNGSAEEASTQPYRPDLPPAHAALSHAPDGRAGVRLAVQNLSDQFGAKQPRLAMPEGSPFGAVAVDPSACTLCMACAVACPAGALSAGGETPRLTFIESRCHQCGLCADTCPEHAMHLTPRILCDPAVDTPVVLQEAEPFRCIVCGEPFATQAMINRMQNKLAGHWMYAAERQLRRLQMCRTCRTRDALTSRDVNAWNR